jgi:hypothetical protein
MYVLRLGGQRLPLTRTGRTLIEVAVNPFTTMVIHRAAVHQITRLKASESLSEFSRLSKPFIYFWYFLRDDAKSAKWLSALRGDWPFKTLPRISEG